MKKYILILFISACQVPLFAQNKNIDNNLSLGHKSRRIGDIPNLKIGQKVPEVFLHKILNYKDSSAKLSDFYKGKLLILDFWATWCAPCISFLPDLDTLQKEYRDRVSFVTVTNETESKIKRFLKNNKMVKNNSLPFVVEDKILNRYFRHRSIPHEVWIDHNGYVRGISHNFDLTKKNINKVLNNASATLNTKKDRLYFNPSNYANFDDSDLLFRSILAKSDLALNGGYIDIVTKYKQYNRKIKRIFLIDKTILQLFYGAYTKGTAGMVNLKRVHFNVSDSLKYIQTPTKEYFQHNSSLKKKYPNFGSWSYDWMKTNTFSYEFITKEYLTDSLFFKYMMNDLNRYFDITASIEKRIIPCLVIKVADPKDSTLFQTPSKKPYWFWSKGNKDTLRKVQGTPFEYLIDYLNGFKLSTPLVNETGYAGPVDLTLNIGGCWGSIKYDEKQLIRALTRYGLKVSREKRKIDVLVINKR